MRRKSLLTLVLLAACAGVSVRDHVLLPAAVLAYESLHVEIDRGIADGVADGDIDQASADVLLELADHLGVALASGDRAALVSAPWATLEVFAKRGIQDMIDDGDISPGVGALLMSRVANFRDTMAQLLLRVSLPASGVPVAINQGKP